jgi:O-acetylhomoserine (thiol)-lyase
VTQQQNLHFETLLIHGGLEPGPAGATTVPIVQSSSFAHETAEDLEDIFRGRKAGQIYTRLNNPTTESLERRLALLEGGVSAIATASGMAAISTAVLTILRAGDEILSSSSLFGGTYSLFRDTFSNYGITARFVDPIDLDSFAAAVNETTRLIFVETIGNPKMDVPDIQAIGAIARKAGIPLVLDATVTSPYLVRGRDLGADIVIHSTSKFINGTGSVIGGAIIDNGIFNWNSPLFPHFEAFAKKYRQFAFSARLRKLMHKDFGACPAPMNSFLLTEGIETLGLRMERHCSNSLALARFLNDHPKVAWVNYPGLDDSPFHEIAARQFGNRFGGVLTFGLSNKDEAFRLINSLKLARNLANIGDAKTLVIHPASTICVDYTPEQRQLLGVSDEMIRVSVGLEYYEDIIRDFSQSLDSL